MQHMKKRMKRWISYSANLAENVEVELVDFIEL
jgi:hypothetical protein